MKEELKNSYIIQYYKAMQSGEIVVNKYIKSWYSILYDIVCGQNDAYELDIQKGHKPIRFIESFCKQSKGEWGTKNLKLMLFQRAKLEAVFGIVDKKTKLRRFRVIFDMRARKNGKTTENSAIALFLLGADKEQGPEIYSIATNLKQSGLSFEESRKMIKASDELQMIFVENAQRIKCEINNGIFRNLPKSAQTLDGLNAHGIIIDEVHELSQDKYDVLRQSVTARRQWMINMITTAGNKRQGLFDNMYPAMKRIALGIEQNPEFFPLLYQLDEEDDYTDKNTWIKANPTLGVIKKEYELQSAVNEALHIPAFEATLKTKDFNIIGVNNNTWLSYQDIHNERTFDIEKDFKGKLVVCGLDLSRTTDMTAVCFTTWNEKNKEWITFAKYWITKDTYEKLKNTDVPYTLWLQKDLLRISGSTPHLIAYKDVSNYILKFCKETKCRLGWIYYDSYSAEYLVDELIKLNVAELVRCIQGYKTLSLPMQLLGAEIKAHKVNYNNNPITEWCLYNTDIDMDANSNIKPKKSEGKQRLRIDGTAVLLNTFVGINDHMADIKRYGQKSIII